MEFFTKIKEWINGITLDTEQSTQEIKEPKKDENEETIERMLRYVEKFNRAEADEEARTALKDFILKLFTLLNEDFNFNAIYNQIVNSYVEVAISTYISKDPANRKTMDFINTMNSMKNNLSTIEREIRDRKNNDFELNNALIQEMTKTFEGNINAK